MSEWKGFLTESKFYMGYPGYHRSGDLYFAGNYRPQVSDETWAKVQREIRSKKIKFWLAFPRAWLRFHLTAFYDELRSDMRPAVTRNDNIHRRI